MPTSEYEPSWGIFNRPGVRVLWGSGAETSRRVLTLMFEEKKMAGFGDMQKGYDSDIQGKLDFMLVYPSI